MLLNKIWKGSIWSNDELCACVKESNRTIVNVKVLSWEKGGTVSDHILGEKKVRACMKWVKTRQGEGG